MKINNGVNSDLEYLVHDWIKNYERKDELDISYDELSIRVTGKMKRLNGKAWHKPLEAYPYEIVISKDLIQNNCEYLKDGYKALDEIYETIVHELIHIEQYHKFGEGGHDEYFFRRCRDLGIPDSKCTGNNNGKDYNYYVQCENCGKKGTYRYNYSKRLKNIEYFKDNWSCGKCDEKGCLEVIEIN